MASPLLGPPLIAWLIPSLWLLGIARIRQAVVRIGIKHRMFIILVGTLSLIVAPIGTKQPPIGSEILIFLIPIVLLINGIELTTFGVTDKDRKQEVRGEDKDHRGLDSKTLLQVDDTVIAGALIFLTVASVSSSPIKLLLGGFSFLAPIQNVLQYIISAIIIYPFALSTFHVLRPQAKINLPEAMNQMIGGFVILMIALGTLAVLIWLSSVVIADWTLTVNVNAQHTSPGNPKILIQIIGPFGHKQNDSIPFTRDATQTDRFNMVGSQFPPEKSFTICISSDVLSASCTYHKHHIFQLNETVSISPL